MVQMVQLEEMEKTVIFTHGSSDDGFVLLDALIALLILSVTLTAVYTFYVRGFKYQERIEVKLDTAIEESLESDKSLKKVIPE